jgi:hypothetical protein
MAVLNIHETLENSLIKISLRHISHQWDVKSKVQIWGRIQKFRDWVDNEIYAYNNNHSLRSNIKGCYGGKIH